MSRHPLRRVLTALLGGSFGLSACGDPSFPPLTTSLVDVTVGSFHSCGLDGEGRAYCWGANERRQLGLSVGASSVAVPAPVAGDLRYASLSAGISHTCGVLLEGGVACWGDNEFGQLGDGTRELRNAPVRVRFLEEVIQVSAGAAFTCALDVHGHATCWGRNTRGQLGNGTFESAVAPIPVSGGRRFRDIVAGGEHTCALDDLGRAHCWGANDQGQSGLVSQAQAVEPARVQGERLYRRLAAGALHTCAVGDLGEAYCWGSNEGAALGDPFFSGERRFGPGPVGGAFRFGRIEVGWGSWSCGLVETGGLACWGQTDGGAFGVSGAARLRGPVLLPLGLWSKVEAGAEHLCGVSLPDHVVECWGEGGSGQLGNGSRADRTAPTRVGG